MFINSLSVNSRSTKYISFFIVPASIFHLNIYTIVIFFIWGSALVTSSTVQAFEGDYIWQEVFSDRMSKAKAGDASAQYNIASMYEKGKGVKPNASEAFKWYEKAAKQGHDKASFKVGFSYLHAKGVNKNYQKAFTWLNKAAKKGNVRAYYFLGRMYEKGDGVDVNLEKSLDWYTKAHDGGYPVAEERIQSVKESLIDSKPAIFDAEMDDAADVYVPEEDADYSYTPSSPVQLNQTDEGDANLKNLLLKSEWSKLNKPALFLPSALTTCEDKEDTVECKTNDIRRDIGIAEINYSTRSILYDFDDTGQFHVSYRNNVHSINITNKNFAVSGGEVPIALGEQDEEHKLSCHLIDKNSLQCQKNKYKRYNFVRYTP